ncbi:MAG: hypothetical protein L0196_08320 [candidate division Zixibacteria bacterium]|nr:hypothetical protein [candidate division Zixibacteria bacterium]
MKKILFLALGLLLFFGPAGAVDKKGKVGVGFFNDDAPIGGRYWVTDRFGVDVGFGLNLRNVVDSTVDTNLLPLIAIEPSKKSLTEFRFDAGFPINLIRTEKVNFLARPGFSYQRIPFFNQIFKASVDTIITANGDDSVFLPGDPVRDTITDDRSRIIDVSLTFGVEYFPTESFSVSLFSGIGAQRVQRSRWRRDENGAYVAGGPGNPRTDEGTRAEEQSLWTVTHRPFLKGVNIGFHYYF